MTAEGKLPSSLPAAQVETMETLAALKTPQLGQNRHSPEHILYGWLASFRPCRPRPGQAAQTRPAGWLHDVYIGLSRASAGLGSTPCRRPLSWTGTQPLHRGSTTTSRWGPPTPGGRALAWRDWAATRQVLASYRHL